MLTPSRTRYRKPHRGRTRGKAYRGCDVLYGSYGLMALEPGWIKANHIEACRISITRRIKKFGKMWIRIFPDKPYTKKPAETRQGKGKGNVEGYVAVVRPGSIMFEVHVTDNEPLCREALTRAMHKLPVKCKIVEKLELK